MLIDRSRPTQMELSLLNTSNFNIFFKEKKFEAIEAENITYLKHDLYKATVCGNVEVFNQYQLPLHCLLTPNQNTVLHIYLATQNFRIQTLGFIPSMFQRIRAYSCRSTSFVEQILNKCPSLLLKPNAKGEIPLHIAAKFGHANIVKFLIEQAKAVEHRDLENGIEPGKQMFRTRDNEGNTALHGAVQFGHENVVHALLQEDPDLSFSVNNIGESPLYIAARRGHHLSVIFILDKCESASHDGPYGRTALHAAVMAVDIRSTRVILSKKKNLIKAVDENGQTALHYASHIGCHSIVKLLLECDESVAYKVDKDQMTALHMAARQGCPLVMREIIQYCPGCCEIVDKRGWNFFHFASVALSLTSLAKFLRVESCRKFLDEKDIYGNTPIQVFDASRQTYLNFAACFEEDLVTVRMEYLDTKKREQILKLLEEVGAGEVAGIAVNPLRLQKVNEVQRGLAQVRKSNALVAALIATVAFTAAFTLPGGFRGDPNDGKDRGTAILSHNSAFKVFVIADAFAFVTSLFAINLNSLSGLPNLNPQRGKISRSVLMMVFTALAKAGLVIAFIAGLFAVINPLSALAMSTCVLIMFFVIVYWWYLYKMIDWEV